MGSPPVLSWGMLSPLPFYFCTWHSYSSPTVLLEHGHLDALYALPSSCLTLIHSEPANSRCPVYEQRSENATVATTRQRLERALRPGAMSRVRATARITRLDRTRRGVVGEQQARCILTRLRRATRPHCLRAALLGVQRRTPVVSDRRHPLLHGQGAPCTSAWARPDVFSNLRGHKALHA